MKRYINLGHKMPFIVKPFRITLLKTNGYIKDHDGNKYLTLNLSK